jgi:flagellar biosynthesis protein FlhA
MPKRIKYTIKSCPADDVEGLQELLNEMSNTGWELYSMTEVEADDKILLNCIFMSEDFDIDNDDEMDFLGWGTVRNPIEKMLSPTLTPYEKSLDIISKIKEQRRKIEKIKSALDLEDAASFERKRYNDKISSCLSELEKLKRTMAEMANPSNLYSRLGVDLVSVHVGEELVPYVDTDSEEKDCLMSELMRVRYDNVDKLGYVIPPMRILDSSKILPNEFNILVRGNVVFRGIVYPGYRMFFANCLNLTKKMKEAIYDVDYITGEDIIWIKEDKAKDYWSEGFSPVEFIARAIDFILIKYVDELFTYEVLQKYCRIAGGQDSFLVENLVPDLVSFPDLRFILSSLLRERVSIKDLALIFERMNDYAQSSLRSDLLSKLRLAMSRVICEPYVNEDGVIRVLELSEKTFNKVIPEIDQEEDIVKIDSEFAQKLADKIVAKSREFGLDVPILVIPMEFRHMFFGILSNYINNIVVLAPEELGNDFTQEIVSEV